MTNFHSKLQINYAILQAKEKTSAQRNASIIRIKNLLAPHLPKHCNRALDLGAGQGVLIEALHHLGCRDVHGVEISSSQVLEARRHGCNSVKQGDALETLINLPENSLDLITCFDVFEHLSHELCGVWLDHITRVLRPEGRLIGHVPNGLSPFYGYIFWSDLTHLWCPVPESIKVFCRASNLHWLGAYENIGASSGIKGKLRTLAWLVVRATIATASTIETGKNELSSPWSRTFLFVAAKPLP